MGTIDEAGSFGWIFGGERRAPATFLVQRREASDGRREPEAWRVCGDGRAALWRQRQSSVHLAASGGCRGERRRGAGEAPSGDSGGGRGAECRFCRGARTDRADGDRALWRGASA